MKSNNAARNTIFHAGAGALVLALAIFLTMQMTSTWQQTRAWAMLVPNVRNLVTTGHDSQMQVNNGQDVPEDDVRRPLADARALLDAAYHGRPSAIGDFPTTGDEDLKAALKQLAIDIEKLEAKSGKRSAVTTDYDAAHNSAHAALSRLGSLIERKIKVENDRTTSFAWLLIAAVAALVIGGAFWLYRLARRSEKTNYDIASKLNTETRRVEKLTQFIESVSAGNYDIELQADESDENDVTSKLVAMRDKLKMTAVNDRRRNWVTTGQAQIGEILRSTSGTSAELYDNIIRFLVKYTRSNQGGLFILNEEDEKERYLELAACYAFERKKYLTKKVGIGDGLVGQCFLEGERIHLLEVPKEYISITSGLGGSNPNALLIVPMKVNDRIYGVIEMASFNPYEEHEIELVEKLAESIASTISNVRVNDTTRGLLERTQQQAEEMKSQEEEIRQNMEELEATQEEMRRKQSILERELDQSQRQAEVLKLQEEKLTRSQETLQAIVDNIPRAIFWKDRELNFMGCNRIFASIAGASSPEELIGKSDYDMAWSAQADAYRADDMEVVRSKRPKLDIEEVNINSEGEESWVRTSKVPIVRADGEVVAILGMFEDITSWKRNEADVARKLRERDEALRELDLLREQLSRKNS